MSTANTVPMISWQEKGATHSARWRSEAGVAPPKRVVIADDTMNADRAYRLACEGTALLWRGDFQNARQLLQALMRRVDQKPEEKKPASAAAAAAPASAASPKAQAAQAAQRARALASPPKVKPAPTPAEAFHLHRMAQAQRARTLGMLLLQFEPDHQIELRRAPDVRRACIEAYGAEPAAGAVGTAGAARVAGATGAAVADGTAIAGGAAGGDTAPLRYVASMRELLGLISAYEWRKKGVEIAALEERIHPHYGVFAPVRSEYVKLVNQAPLSKTDLAFDIGTGTGVLAAVLSHRGVKRVVATDNDPRALACARANIKRLGMTGKVDVVQADLFPPSTALPKAGLIVCNPPWLPARPSAPLEHAIYDFESRMLRGFLAGVAERLAQGGEAWLILSDLAEHLGLRTRAELEGWIDAGGLQVQGRIDARPEHPKVFDVTDPLHAARRAETTSLWRLTRR